MNARIFGIDCAVDDANMGVAWGRVTATRLVVQEATHCTRKRTAIDAIASWIEQEKTDRALLAIDAPLGWPAALPVALSKHKAGEEILTEPNAMFRRCTDRFIHEKVGKNPLDVGAGRIARTAHSALRLLGDLRRRLRCDIPLAWSPEQGESIAAIEVYPAATLLAHNIKASGCKQEEKSARRKFAINSLPSHLSLPQDTSAIQESDDALDAVVCLLAGDDFLRGQAIPPTDNALAKKEGWIWVFSPPKPSG